MKRKYLLPHIAIFFAVFLCNSQNPITNMDSYLPVVPQAPNTASLLKYEEAPVSKNSGVPQIGVPIHTISVDGINIPVALSYNSSGIRVNEIAPWTGHGWSLIAGGSITRTVRHLPDDNQYGYMWTSITTSEIYDKCMTYNPPHPDCTDYTNTRIRNHTLDFEPDIFTYNVPGTSGKFMFNQIHGANEPGQVKSFPISNDKITPIFNAQKNIIAWTIYDTQGNKFEFEEGNTLTSNKGYTIESMGNLPQDYPVEPLNPNLNYYTQTWNLSRITTYNGNVINFSYYDDSANDYEECSFSGQSRTMTDEMNNIKTTYVGVRGRYTELNSISGSFGAIVFNKGGQRDDYPEGRFLSEILVEAPGNVLKKKFDLKYSYTMADSYPSNIIFGCGGEVKPTPIWNTLYHPNNPTAYDPYMKHMFLDEVEVFDALGSSNDTRKYSFEYYNEYKLPHRNSYAQDFWGYYNGANNNTLLFDYTSRYTNTPYRHVEPEYAITGLLKKMYFPTGGHKEFTYEGNWATTVCGNAFGFRLIPSDEKVLNFNSQIDEYTISDGSEYNLQSFCDFVYTFSKPLILNKRTFIYYSEMNQRVANFNFAIEQSTSNGQTICVVGENNLPQVGECSLWVTARKTTLDPELYEDESQIDLSNLTFDTNFQLFRNAINTEDTKGDDFPIGVYVFDFHIAGYNDNLNIYDEFDIENDLAIFNITIRKAKEDVKFYDDYRVVEIPIGGMRIKKIEDFTSENAIAKRREFNYVMEDSIRTSGRVLRTPYFISGDHSRIVESSLSAVPLITTNAGNVNYTRVSEDIVDYNSSTRKLSTVSTFRYYDLPYIYRNPMIPFIEDWRYGQEVNTEIPSKKFISRGFDDLFVPIDHQDPSTYHYAILPPTISLPYTFTIEENMSALDFVNNGGQYIGEDFYELQYGHLVQDYQGERTYIHNNPEEYIEKKIHYFYDNDDYFQPTSVETIVEDDKKIRQKFYYPYDLIGVESFADTLMYHNRFASPMIEESYIVENNQESLLSKTKTTFSAGSGKILPRTILTAKGENDLETRVVYNDYDVHGNPIDVSIVGGTHTAYIWGYGGQHLVAKIENLAHSQIPSQLVSDIEGTSNEGTLLGYLQQLRNLAIVQDSQVTTFTYLPLVGLSTVTDPKGYRMSYFYDDFGRLKYVKDMDNNVLSENQYHYIND
ncbi:hypothetical protein [Aequorivita sp. KMM 9714]|uniref:hypothetical protein n=1 Tax=Aequorivita sp. KMM 9714 TaxID=2707173 RepID=UPI0013EBBD25|nr:hypothetical protein [Aequorivita sp. KMM 9714]NGX82676.1 hypothetical protein [Aequorivita sp. KMM 9714]